MKVEVEFYIPWFGGGGREGKGLTRTILIEAGLFFGGDEFHDGRGKGCGNVWGGFFFENVWLEGERKGLQNGGGSFFF